MHQHRVVIEERVERHERGAGLVEYALLLALIALVTFSAVSFFGNSSKAGYGHSTDCIRAAYDGSAMPEDC